MAQVFRQMREVLEHWSRLLVGQVCPVCGEPADFTGFTENLRESGSCSSCQSSNRQRQMAFVLRQSLGMSMRGAFVLRPGFSLYNLESNGPLHVRLSTQPGYVCSEYFGPEYIPGEVVRGIRHEDLQRLTFPEAHFNQVLSSDVMEHVPDPYRAHREIHRVLKPGGRHVFTVPYVPSMEKDDVRARLADGQVQYLAEKLFHGDPVRPDEGILVWTIFGREMLEKLAAIGFDVKVLRLSEPRRGILGDNAIVFVLTKRTQ